LRRHRRQPGEAIWGIPAKKSCLHTGKNIWKDCRTSGSYPWVKRNLHHFAVFDGRRTPRENVVPADGSSHGQKRRKVNDIHQVLTEAGVK
jgi:hypothetical protein